MNNGGGSPFIFQPIIVQFLMFLPQQKQKIQILPNVHDVNWNPGIRPNSELSRGPDPDYLATRPLAPSQSNKDNAWGSNSRDLITEERGELRLRERGLELKGPKRRHFRQISYNPISHPQSFIDVGKRIYVGNLTLRKVLCTSTSTVFECLGYFWSWSW